MPVIPTIQPAGPVSVGAHSGHDTAPDWTTLLQDIKQEVARYLGVADLNNVSLASAPWHGAPSAKVFDQACRAVIQKAESGPLCDLPAVDATRFAGKARGLADAGFPHAALLLNLQQVRAGLERVPTAPATHVSCQVPMIAPYGGLGAVCAPGGKSELVVKIYNQSGELGLGFCSGQGVIRQPELLRNAELVPGNLGGPSIYDARMSRGDAVMVVRDREEGRMALYRLEADRVEPLPDAFTGRWATAHISANGRYVAADIGGRLLVYDRDTKDIVTRVEGHATNGVSVDALGNVVAGAYPGGAPGEGALLGRGEAAWANLGRQGFHNGCLLVCPNDRYLVKMYTSDSSSALSVSSLALVDRQRSDICGIELRPPEGEVLATAIAFSPANAMVAVAYVNDTISLFDLAGLAGDAMPSPVIAEPKCNLALPHRAGQQSPALFFSPDGTRLDVVYHTIGKHPTAEFLSYELLGQDHPSA